MQILSQYGWGGSFSRHLEATEVNDNQGDIDCLPANIHTAIVCKKGGGWKGCDLLAVLK